MTTSSVLRSSQWPTLSSHANANCLPRRAPTPRTPSEPDSADGPQPLPYPCRPHRKKDPHTDRFQLSIYLQCSIRPRVASSGSGSRLRDRLNAASWTCRSSQSSPNTPVTQSRMEGLHQRFRLPPSENKTIESVSSQWSIYRRGEDHFMMRRTLYLPRTGFVFAPGRWTMGLDEQSVALSAIAH